MKAPLALTGLVIFAGILVGELAPGTGSGPGSWVLGTVFVTVAIVACRYASREGCQ